MTVYKAADMPKWAMKFEKITTAIIQQATNDMLNDVKIVPGITRGGSRKKGTIPRDLGALAGSQQSTLYGSTALTAVGEQSHLLVITQMKVGVMARFSWGGNAAPYAEAIHYGSGNTAGTFWIDVMANGWRRYVRVATNKAKAAIR